MGWPIPDIPEQSPLPSPRFSIWAGIMVIMVTMGSLLTLFIGNFSTYGPIFMYGALPAFLLWVCIFGVALNRYNQSSAAVFAWEEESLETKRQWQRWSRKQLAIVGNVFLSPESDGVASILGDPSKIPMYPKKMRSLSIRKQTLAEHLKLLSLELDAQIKGYRNHLYNLYVLKAGGLNERAVHDAIYDQWDLFPEFVNSFEDIPCFNVDTDFNNLALVICLQCWPNRTPQKSSEFISAQLLCTPDFMESHKYELQAAIGRVMPVSIDTLPDDLTMLFDYNKLDTNSLQHVWLSGDTEKNAANVARYADLNKWSLPEKRPIHYVDLTFGPPGEHAFEISLSMMVDAIRHSSENQLIIYQKSPSTGWLCLLTRELFS